MNYDNKSCLLVGLIDFDKHINKQKHRWGAGGGGAVKIKIYKF